MRFLRSGPDAVLVELPDGPAVLALLDALAAARERAVEHGSPLARITETVPAACTVLVRVDPADGPLLGRIVAAVVALPLAARTARSGTLVEIPVLYDGEDLADVAEHTGLSVAEVVRRHTAVVHDVAFTGFAPGFAYLSGGDPALVVPRRASPRPVIPAGSVAIAGEYSGVYPRASPGGWQLLGRTPTPMWDETRAEPALLRPGMRVRFVAVGDEVRPAPMSPPRGAVGPTPLIRDTGALEVVAVGALATVQDLGRDGHAAAGVSRSGAMDRPALRRANRLVGNPVGAAAIEHAGGLVLRAVRPVVVAVTGAGVLDPDDRDRPIALGPDDVLQIGPPDAGVFGYVAVLGGVDARQVLGSRSTDVLSGLGPDPLRPGDRLAVRTDHGAAVADAPEPGPTLPSVRGDGPAVTVDVVLGPRDDWFGPDALAALTGRDRVVAPRSNRVGIRLDGAPLERDADHVGAELPSEAMRPGSVQVPPDGQPVLFAADHPVTGGYPVIATVLPSSLARAVQVPVGGRIRFRVVPLRPPPR